MAISLAGEEQFRIGRWGPRRSFTFSYDRSRVRGVTMRIRKPNPADGWADEQVTWLPNEGTFELAFPFDFSGRTSVEVHGSTGGTDAGEIAIEEVEKWQ